MPWIARPLAAVVLAAAVAACGGSGDTGKKSGFCGSSTGAACGADGECARGGCSGQVCAGAAEQIVTTCEWQACYAPEPYGVTCGCSSGACGWR